jgi:hypothetical protein
MQYAGDKALVGDPLFRRALPQSIQVRLADADVDIPVFFDLSIAASIRFLSACVTGLDKCAFFSISFS